MGRIFGHTKRPGMLAVWPSVEDGVPVINSLTNGVYDAGYVFDKADYPDVCAAIDAGNVEALNALARRNGAQFFQGC